MNHLYVMGAFYCIRAAMPLLKATKGNIVNVTSVAANQRPGGKSVSTAAKKHHTEMKA